MVISRPDLLRTFEEVVECKTMHAAAKRLGLTQVAVTKRIKLLESDLSLSLFLRSRRGVTLTEEGTSVLQYCRRVREAEGELAAKIRGNARTQELNLILVGPTSFVSARLAPACVPFYERYPFLRIHLWAEDHLNRVELVRQGRADLAIVPKSSVPNEMDSKVLRSDRYLLVASPKWKGRKLESILQSERIIDFEEADATTADYLKSFRLEHRSGRGRIFVNNNEALIRYFREGVGFGTLTEAVAIPHIEQGNLIRLNQGKAYEDPLALVWYGRSKAVQYFAEIVRSIV